MQCPKCGTEIGSFKFCTNCGYKVPDAPARSSASGFGIVTNPTPEPDHAPSYKPAASPAYNPAPSPAYNPAPEPTYRPAASSYTPPAPTVVNVAPRSYSDITADELPERFRPLGAWAYFGYGLLFSIPIVGFILLIVFSCKKTNINRRNFARSYFCWLVILAIVIVVLLLLGVSLGDVLSNILFY